MKEVKRTERGWAGHLMFASGCRFRRNTLLEYEDKKWIISTVGAYVNSDRIFDTIGYNRFYETMAFEATEQNGYLDADVSREIPFESEWGIFGETWKEVIEKYPKVDNVANDMHEKVVSELMFRIAESEE
jgi:hypothetical protein